MYFTEQEYSSMVHVRTITGQYRPSMYFAIHDHTVHITLAQKWQKDEWGKKHSRNLSGLIWAGFSCWGKHGYKTKLCTLRVYVTYPLHQCGLVSSISWWSDTYSFETFSQKIFCEEEVQVEDKKRFKKKTFFLVLCPKLWVGGGQKS